VQFKGQRYGETRRAGVRTAEEVEEIAKEVMRLRKLRGQRPW
jgi:hypothetical protein